MRPHLLRDAECYYPSAQWALSVRAYSLDRDVWGTRYSPTVRSRIRVGLSLLRPWLVGDKTIVDLGVGAGGHSAVLVSDVRSAGCVLISIDLSLTALRLAAARLGDKRDGVLLCQADAELLPFGDSSVDVLICAEVLEHVQDDRRAAAEIFRVLQPGGVAYVSVPLERRASTFWHARCYDPEAILGLLRSAGFSIQTVLSADVLTSRDWRYVRYGFWVIWLIATGNLLRQVRRDTVPAFYASRFCRNIVVPLFDFVSKLDVPVAAADGRPMGKTLHCVVKKGRA